MQQKYHNANRLIEYREGLINTQGQEVVKCIFDWIQDFKPRWNGLAMAKLDDEWGFLDTKGKWFSYGSIINEKGELIVECKNENI